jgi:hypothetical protein
VAPALDGGLGDSRECWGAQQAPMGAGYHKRTEKTLREGKVPMVPDRRSIATVSIPGVHRRVHEKPCQSLGAS